MARGQGIDVTRYPFEECDDANHWLNGYILGAIKMSTLMLLWFAPLDHRMKEMNQCLKALVHGGGAGGGSENLS